MNLLLLYMSKNKVMDASKLLNEIENHDHLSKRFVGIKSLVLLKNQKINELDDFLEKIKGNEFIFAHLLKAEIHKLRKDPSRELEQLI